MRNQALERLAGTLKAYILISENSQSEQATYPMLPTIWYSGKGKTMRQ